MQRVGRGRIIFFFPAFPSSASYARGVVREGDLPSLRASVHSMVMILVHKIILSPVFSRLVVVSSPSAHPRNRLSRARKAALAQGAIAFELGLGRDREAGPTEWLPVARGNCLLVNSQMRRYFSIA